jgi:hypothetical protein
MTHNPNYPFFQIAKDFNLPYNEVLSLAKEVERIFRVEKDTALQKWHFNPTLLRRIYEAVRFEHNRREHD